MRLVASPHFRDEDVEAMDRGYEKRAAVVERSLGEAVEELEHVAATDYSTQMLTWLIANNRLSIKIALPTRTPNGIYHEKIGIIRDSYDAVAFTGSFNETGAGLVSNFESIDVFTSWSDSRRVSEKITDFEALWNDHTDGLEVVDFPIALKRRLIAASPSGCPAPQKIDDGVSQSGGYNLRPYQLEAIRAWIDHDRRGIFEMATGTGKTKTALSAVSNAISEGARTVIALAPLKHLVSDWARQLEETVGVRVIRCFSDYEWRRDISLAASRARISPQPTPLVVAATYATAQTGAFVDAILKMPKPLMLVADEVHNTTLDASVHILQERYAMRLGLSATPERFKDEPGTAALYDYFGGVIFKFGIADAIRAGYLTPYDYIPVFCRFSQVEAVEYDLIRQELGSARGENAGGTPSTRLTEILKQREALIQSATDKVAQFERIVAGGTFNEGQIDCDRGILRPNCRPKIGGKADVICVKYRLKRRNVPLKLNKVARGVWKAWLGS